MTGSGCARHYLVSRLCQLCRSWQARLAKMQVVTCGLKGGGQGYLPAAALVWLYQEE